MQTTFKNHPVVNFLIQSIAIDTKKDSGNQNEVVTNTSTPKTKTTLCNTDKYDSEINSPTSFVLSQIENSLRRSTGDGVVAEALGLIRAETQSELFWSTTRWQKSEEPMTFQAPNGERVIHSDTSGALGD